MTRESELTAELRRAREELKAAKDALQREKVRAREFVETRLKLLFEDAPVPLLLLDGEMRITAANGAFCRMLGAIPDELVGRDLSSLTPKAERGVDVPFARLLREGKNPETGVIQRFATEFGTTVQVRLRGSVTYGPDGGILEALCAAEELA